MIRIVVLAIILVVSCAPPGPPVVRHGQSVEQYENDLMGCRQYAEMDPHAHPKVTEAVISMLTLTPMSSYVFEHTPGQPFDECMRERGYEVQAE